ncbi:metallophosphoesterase family protein [Deinococcus aestuarii]|uniref:metallophosphoesterase family protein n=1 Tax=Deinococcus aestuarii TaxID=2774531 RepID=UPI001C0C9821|nr:DNA repair exonuclease [Deinococcus aestuarii]
MDPIRIIHIADLHLGFTGPPTLLVSEGEQAGRPVREVDVERAAAWMADTIPRLTPAIDLVLVAGDLFHRSTPLPRAVASAAHLVARLRGVGIDVVIIDGNHDTPSRVTQGSPTAFLEALGSWVVSGQPRQIRGDDWSNARLRSHVVVHAVPASTDPGDDGVQPEPGHVNILLAHGRHDGTSEANSGRRGATISSDLLRRGWTYAALGDCHAHGERPLTDVPAYYAGSAEALTFGEAPEHPARSGDPYASGGMLLVTAASAADVAVTSLPYPGRRAVVRLGEVDGEHLSGDQLLDELDARTSAVPDGAVASVKVRRCPPHLRASVNMTRLKGLQARCLLLDVEWEVVDPEVLQSEVPASPGRLEDQWSAYLDDHAHPGEDVAWLLERGGALLQQARDSGLHAEEEL